MESFSHIEKHEKTEGNDSTPLISVIVPIYNVEKYIGKCLESLRNQTMKQIEVICIDDGSTDTSGEIADEYESKEYPIFRVIHTKNGGLSAARNRGIDESIGGWLMFVDSDDWVHEDFCRIPYETAIRENADLVIFGWCDEKKDKIKKKTIYEWEGLIDEFTAHELGHVMAWNKLYKRDLFSVIRYPVGRVYEDGAVTHKLIHMGYGGYDIFGDALDNCVNEYIDEIVQLKAHAWWDKDRRDRGVLFTYIDRLYSLAKRILERNLKSER